MVWQTVMAVGVVVTSGCTHSGAVPPRGAGAQTGRQAVAAVGDTALFRRACIAADDRTVGPESLVVLSKRGCVLRDQGQTFRRVSPPPR